MTEDDAAAIALGALTWMGSQGNLLETFLGSTGLSADDLRAGLSDAELQAAILDFVLMDDSWVIGVAESVRQPPEAVLRARAQLPGGQLPHWT